MASDTATHRVMYDGLYTLVMRGVNIVAAIALGILTARLLGPAGKGVYAMPMVQAGLVATAFGGLSSATTYFMFNRRSGRRVLRAAFLCAVILCAVAAVAVLAIAAISHALWAAVPAILSLPGSAATCIVLGYVAGIKRIRYNTTLAVATTLTMLVLMVAGLFGVAKTPWVAIAVWIVSTTIVSAVALAAVLLHARKLPQGEPIPVREYFRMTVKVGATALVTLLNYRADLYIVAAMLGTFSLGLYTVAVSAAESLLVPTQVTALVASPHIGSLDRATAARITARCVRNNLLLAGILCAIIFIWAPFLINLLYGAAFLPLVPALRILLVGVVALSVGSPVSSYYTLKLGKPEISLVLSASSAAICIALAVVLAPHMGISGAAVASTAAYLVGQGLGLGYFCAKAHVPMREVLLPTADDLRTYAGFVRRVYRDAAGLLTLRLRPEGK